MKEQKISLQQLDKVRFHKSQRKRIGTGMWACMNEISPKQLFHRKYLYYCFTVRKVAIY